MAPRSFLTAVLLCAFSLPAPSQGFVAPLTLTWLPGGSLTRRPPAPHSAVTVPLRAAASTYGGDDGDGSGDGPQSPLRRSAAASLAAAPFLVAFSIPPSVSAAETAAQSIRVASSNLPGMGKPDVYYPPYFAGRWRATREVAESDDNVAEVFGGLLKLPFAVEYEVRFVSYGEGGEGGATPAVADRAFNERSYRGALVTAAERAAANLRVEDKARVSAGLDPSPSPPPPLPTMRSIDWTQTNPNVLSVSYADGSSREIKVTKRSTDISSDGTNVFSSEFRRITTVKSSNQLGPGGIPVIRGSRVLCKWKKVDDGTVEGIEISYDERGTLGDNQGMIKPPSFYGDGNGKDQSDWRSTKSKIRLERL